MLSIVLGSCRKGKLERKPSQDTNWDEHEQANS